MSGRVLVVTNDFPPRDGGIQTFVYELVRRMPPDSVTVFTSTWKGAAEFDAEQPFEVVRIEGSMMLPVPAVRRQAVELVQSRDVSSVVFGAAVPLGLLAPALREAGAVASARDHARPRGVVGLGARGSLGRAPGRERAGRHDLPRRVHARSVGVRGRRGPRGPAAPADAGRGPVGVPPRRRPRPGARAARRRVGAGRGVRLAADAAQGAGHVDPVLAGGAGVGARRPAGDRRVAGRRASG